MLCVFSIGVIKLQVQKEQTSTLDLHFTNAEDRCVSLNMEGITIPMPKMLQIWLLQVIGTVIMPLYLPKVSASHSEKTCVFPNYLCQAKKGSFLRSTPTSSYASSFRKIVSSGSSFQGRCMLGYEGRKESVRRNGEISLDCTLLELDGGSIVG